MTTAFSESKIPTSLANDRTSTAGVRSIYVRYFFVSMGLLFIVINALGFVPQLVAIHELKIPLHWFTHVHGAVMTIWLLLYLAQTALAARGQLTYHRHLGIFSVGWGIIVWATSIIVLLSALVRDNPPEASGQFATLALGLVGLTVFGLFFCWGIRARKSAAVHKRLVFLSMLPLMSAGIDRMGFLPALQSAYFVRLVYLDLLLIPLVVYDFIIQQRIHRITLIGVACLLVAQGAVVGAAGSPAWHRLVYNALTPYVTRIPEVTLSNAQSEPLLGNYGDKNWHMTIGRDDGRLFLQMPGQLKWELGAYSETALFLKTDKVTLHFVKDPHGQIAKIVVTQPDKTWEAPKMTASVVTTKHGDH